MVVKLSNGKDKQVLDERTISLGQPWNSWVDVYRIFTFISSMNKGNPKLISAKISDFCELFSGVKEVDLALQKWNERE